MGLRAIVAGLVAVVLGWATRSPAQTFDGNRFARTPSRIIQSISTGKVTCAPVVPPCTTNPSCLPTPCAFPVFSYPIYVGYSGYYGGYSSSRLYDSYALGALADENERLRERIERLEERERQAAQAAPPVQLQVPPKNHIDRERAQSSVRAGLRLFQKGSYVQAAQKFQTAVKASPGDPAALAYLAQAQFAAGQTDRAIVTLKDLLSQHPDWPEAEIDLSVLYGDDADLIDQMGVLARRLQEHPLDSEAMFLLAFELFVTGEFDRSRAVFEQAARLSPDDAHLKPFFDYFARRDAVQPDQTRDNGIPIPDLLLAAGK